MRQSLDLGSWYCCLNHALRDFDPALGMMTGIPPINPMMPGLGIVPPPIPPDMPAAKEIIHCKSCTLFPPNPRFEVGYRIRLGSSTDKKDTGRLHVDFAQARDDLYEWECKQRMLAREERHRRRLEEERFRPPSPPPVVHYSDHECSVVAEKLKVEQIVAVYHSASKQKAWDHFTKAQRKNISVWCKQAEVALVSQVEALKEENDSLRWQLDAYRNEVELLKQEQGKASRDEDTTKEQQMKLLQQALQGMQKHLLKVQEEYKKREAELEKVKEDKLKIETLLENLKEQQSTADEEDKERDAIDCQGNESGTSRVCACSQEKEGPVEKTSSSSPVKSEREVLLVGIISTFLHVHPFGASIEYICSYLQRLDSKICTAEVEVLMTRLQNTFRQELSGVGASLEKRWKFCGFDGLKMT
ncbi:ecto-nox disulfide-thiol exchanger 2 [Limosa lapponica baueri]|uniref:Ecto-nox disulfide-thiol exchanger 2 n=1 Tax=Limosa lapponica baueri TaxID=1758121 RepID=A0A2I0TEQ5_LIMLA|nr:ecto-nox disulfide-thiol exchanger 2 [Limosa lapponica baueri]